MRQQVTQPGMQRAQEVASAMRARGASEAAIARALGYVPRDLPCGDPFRMDPRGRRAEPPPRPAPAIVSNAEQDARLRALICRELAARDAATRDGEARRASLVIEAAIKAGNLTRPQFFETGYRHRDDVVWRAAAAWIMSERMRLNHYAIARAIGIDRTSIRGYRKRWWDSDGEMAFMCQEAVRRIEREMVAGMEEAG